MKENEYGKSIFDYDKNFKCFNIDSGMKNEKNYNIKFYRSAIMSAVSTCNVVTPKGKNFILTGLLPKEYMERDKLEEHIGKDFYDFSKSDWVKIEEELCD